MAWLRRPAPIALELPAPVEPEPAGDGPDPTIGILRDTATRLRAELDESRAEVRQLRGLLAEVTDPQARKRIGSLERELAELRRFLAIQSDQLARAEKRPEVGASTW